MKIPQAYSIKQNTLQTTFEPSVQGKWSVGRSVHGHKSWEYLHHDLQWYTSTMCPDNPLIVSCGYWDTAKEAAIALSLSFLEPTQ